MVILFWLIVIFKLLDKPLLKFTNFSIINHQKRSTVYGKDWIYNISGLLPYLCKIVKEEIIK